MMKVGKRLYSFRAAYLKIPAGDIKQVKEELKKALGITHDSLFSKKLNEGVCDPRLSIIEKVECVFNEHGIKNPWQIKKNHENRCTTHRKTATNS